MSTVINKTFLGHPATKGHHIVEVYEWGGTNTERRELAGRFVKFSSAEKAHVEPFTTGSVPIGIALHHDRNNLNDGCINVCLSARDVPVRTSVPVALGDAVHVDIDGYVTNVLTDTPVDWVVVSVDSGVLVTNSTTGEVETTYENVAYISKI